MTLIGGRAFHNENIVASVAPRAHRRSCAGRTCNACCVAFKFCQTRGRWIYGGKKNVEQVYPIHPDREGAWHRVADVGFQLSSRYPGGHATSRKPNRQSVPCAE